MAQATKARETATSVTISFTKEKETKNTIRYQEDGTDSENRGKIGTLYVQKSALPEMPDKLVVTLTRG